MSLVSVSRKNAGQRAVNGERHGNVEAQVVGKSTQAFRQLFSRRNRREGAHKLVFCAGQVAADPTGKVLPPDDFGAQTKMVMANLALALEDGGASLKDVVKVTIYICNPHDVPKARAILQEYFGNNPPASTLCVLRGLANPNFLLEIEAIAAV